jgi:hypothetical protein
MSDELQIVKSPQGWIVEMTPQIAEVAGVDVRSVILLYVNRDCITAEIIPPLEPELACLVDETIEAFQDAFVEIKNRGD